MTDLQLDETPEFHVVVRHPNRRGPLGPYRLALAVGFSLLIAGSQLLEAASTGIGIDAALLRALMAAWFIWVLVGIVSRILAAGRRAAPPTTTPAADLPDPRHPAHESP